MKEYTAHIKQNLFLGGRYYRLDLGLDQAFDACRGGEFVMLSTGYQEGHILRRPMAVFDQQGRFSISILYQTSGVGTHWLAEQKKGVALSLLGALGNHFASIQSNEKIAVIAGGIGVAPFLLWLRRQKPAFYEHIKLYFGFRNEAEAIEIEKYFMHLNMQATVWTDEKNQKYRQGLVLNAFIKDFKDGDIPDKIYTCGPNIMMKAVHDQVKEFKIPVYASAEAKMACGMGVCLSCVTEPSALPIGERKLICKDGPILRLVQ